MVSEELGSDRVHVFDEPEPPTVSQVLAAATTAFVGVVLDDVSFWGRDAWRGLREQLATLGDVALLAPVSNEAAVAAQRVPPCFLYQTPSVLRLACEETRRRRARETAVLPAIDPFAFLVRRGDLEALDEATPVNRIPEALAKRGRRLAIALDTYVHRYSRMHDQPRPDLQEWIGSEVETLLDVGCATGELGVAVKAKQSCRVVGIELNTALARVAAERIDRVLTESIETLPSATFAAEFDAIVCGDVLEHLVDPWAVVEKLAGWLRPNGRLVATLPNVGHWSLVRDLLGARWDLIPFGLLCYGHLRFFTRGGIDHLFARGGLDVEQLIHLKDGLPPIGEDFVAKAVATLEGVDRESLETNEFLVVARRR